MTTDEILAVWNEIASDKDISTERALEMTRQRCHFRDIGPVVDALSAEHEREERRARREKEGV